MLWLHLILGAIEPIFSKGTLGDKQCGRVSNTWLDSKWWEAQQNFHIVLNTSHLNNMYKMALKKYHMMIQHKKHSYLVRKQKHLHFLFKSDQKLIWKNFQEIDESTIPFHATNNRLLHKSMHLKIKYQWSLCSNHSTSWCFYERGNMGPCESPSKLQGQIHELKIWASKMGCKWVM